MGGRPGNKMKLWNDKLIRKLLLIITMADLDRFIPKNKLVTYIKELVELCNWKNHRQVYEINQIIEFEKMYASISENFCNF